MNPDLIYLRRQFGIAWEQTRTGSRSAAMDALRRLGDALERLEDAATTPTHLDALRLCHEYFKACAQAYQGETRNGVPAVVANAEQLETIVNRAGEAVGAIASAEGWA